jgi:phosphoribosylformylglycinamidine synthase PurS subunit
MERRRRRVRGWGGDPDAVQTRRHVMAKERVTITLKKTIMDAQGQTVEKALHNLGYQGVGNLRIGKYIEMDVNGAPAAELSKRVDEMCRKLLANPIIEDFRVEIEE